MIRGMLLLWYQESEEWHFASWNLHPNRVETAGWRASSAAGIHSSATGMSV